MDKTHVDKSLSSNAGSLTQNESPVTDQEKFSSKVWEQANRMRLQEMPGHWWWLVTAGIVGIFSPLLTWKINLNASDDWRNFTGLYFNTIALLLISVWFFFYSWLKLRNSINFETYDAQETKIKGKNIDDEVWQLFRKGGKNSVQGDTLYPRLKILISLVRLELFGWVVYTTSLAVAISAHIQANISNGIFAVLNNATFDITRATILGVITLFFTQMLKNYQNSIDKADNAAKTAKEAAESANKAISQSAIEIGKANDGIKDARWLLEKQTGEFKDVLLSSADALNAEYLLRGMRDLIQEVAGKSNIQQLTAPLASQINNISNELKKSSANELDFIALTVLQSIYFKSESLNFEPSNNTDTTKSTRGCRLSTHYRNYAQTVQTLIDTLEEIPSKKFEYYTLLNATPDEFFNIENNKVNFPWHVNFLEGHCRKHAEKGVKFHRYLTQLDTNSEDKRIGKFYPPSLNEFHSTDFILCDLNDNPKIFSEPTGLSQKLREYNYEHNEQVNEIFERIHLSEDEYNAIHKIIKDSSDDTGNPDKTRDKFFTRPDSYIIKMDSPVKPIANEFLQKLQEEGVDTLRFQPLNTILAKQYHSFPPVILRFSDKTSYDTFFGENVPRDLVAVKEGNEWKLCLGVMIGSDIPNTVSLVFLTPERGLRDLEWNELTNKLDSLFNMKPHKGIQYIDFSTGNKLPAAKRG